MKTIQNKSVPIAHSETQPTSTYGNLATFALNQPPHGGFDLGTLKARLKVSAKVDKAKKTIELEDAEFDTLKQAVQACRWPWNHPCVVEFAAELGL